MIINQWYQNSFSTLVIVYQLISYSVSDLLCTVVCHSCTVPCYQSFPDRKMKKFVIAMLSSDICDTVFLSFWYRQLRVLAVSHSQLRLWDQVVLLNDRYLTHINQHFSSRTDNPAQRMASCLSDWNCIQLSGILKVTDKEFYSFVRFNNQEKN